MAVVAAAVVVCCLLQMLFDLVVAVAVAAEFDCCDCC